MRLRVIGLSLAFMAVACDPDGDGLTSGQEKKIGADPQVADSDGDGLDDLGEWDWGTDPMVGDSDGDGYLDGDEVCAGKDPLDSSSVIYEGGWPFHCDKEAMVDPGVDSPPKKNDMMARFSFRDQHGEKVDLYDFAYQGVPLLIDVSALWCPPCNDLAAYLEGDNTAWASTHPDLPEMVENGDVYWITVLPQDYSGSATNTTPNTWHDLYPSKHIFVLADKKEEYPAWMGLIYFPTTMLVREDLTVEAFDVNEPYKGMDKLQENYGY
jgi:thiol-disulfide isomerase/thioredoxin